MFRVWKEIRSRTLTSQKVPGVVDGRDTDTEIANIFWKNLVQFQEKVLAHLTHSIPLIIIALFQI